MDHRILHLVALLAADLLLAPCATYAANAPTAWTETGAAFKAGTRGDSGQNLYVNRHGELETIRRFDLDGNGHLDLLFNSSHDIYNALPATIATLQGKRLQIGELAVDGSSRVLSADLNRDGYNDLVFMPNHQNVQQQRSSIIIAWGGPTGWTTDRLTRQLPVNGVTSMAIGDLNHDGWPDIVTLNSTGWLFGQPDGKIVRVYWGSPDGFLLTRYQDLGVPGAVEIAAGGFGPERQYPAVVLTENGRLHFLAFEAGAKTLKLATTVDLSLPEKTKAQALVVQSGAHGNGDSLWVGTNTKALLHVGTAVAQPTIETLEASPATHLSLGRLDADPWPDLVLTNLKLIYPLDKADPSTPSVRILWGREGGVDPTHVTALAIPNAIATAVGDLDRDGHADLLVSVYQGNTSQKAESRIYPGNGSRQFDASLPVPTEGAEGVAWAQLTPDALPVGIFANSQHRTLDDAVPLRLFWGVPGGFSRDNFVDIPNLSGYKSSAADLNGDGYVDLIVVNGGDVSEDAARRAPDAGANIYWGGPEGTIGGPGPTRFDPARRQVLPEKHLGSINVADLNGDGYLDVVLGSFESPDKPDTDIVIYYGSAAGLLPENRKTLRVPGRSIGCLIADFNRDGWLDVTIGSYGTNQVITFWGSATGFDENRKNILPYPAPIDLEAADLNHDGWLDLLVGSYEDSVAHHHDTGLSIFWGGPTGWHQSNSQWLPGMTPLGLAVADLDGDGFLDIVSPHYHGELSREQLPSYIYWGSAQGYAPLHRTALTVNSGSEVVIGDFDQDGKLDLAFCAHSMDAGHLLESPVFYNDGQRFASPKVQYLPATGPHYMWVQDIGAISNRRYEETFTSQALSWQEAALGATIAVDAATPFGSKVTVRVRSAGTAAALAAAPWREGEHGHFSLSAQDRFLEYHLTLHSANGDAYPLVRKVDVTLQ